jgi:nucleoside-triphosphatase
MPNNFLVTGLPSSGKTSVIKKTVELLQGRGFHAGGIYCPEIRDGGARVGFKIIDIMTGEERVLAHVNQPEGPQVSKYRVNLQSVDELSGTAIGRALEEADFVVIDEIAPMEIHSDGFRRAVQAALESPKPLLAAIHQKTASGFIGAVKARPDVKILEVTPRARTGLPEQLAQLVAASIKRF